MAKKKQDKHKKWLRRLGLQEKVIEMGLFDFDVVVAIGSRDRLEEYISFKYEIPDFDISKHETGYEPRGQCFHCDGYVPIIWIPNKPKTPREYGTLAHECVHAAKHVMRWAHVPDSDDTEEVLTHTVGYLVTKILDA